MTFLLSLCTEQESSPISPILASSPLNSLLVKPHGKFSPFFNQNFISRAFWMQSSWTYFCNVWILTHKFSYSFFLVKVFWSFRERRKYSFYYLYRGTDTKIYIHRIITIRVLGKQRNLIFKKILKCTCNYQHSWPLRKLFTFSVVRTPKTFMTDKIWYANLRRTFFIIFHNLYNVLNFDRIVTS